MQTTGKSQRTSLFASQVVSGVVKIKLNLHPGGPKFRPRAQKVSPRSPKLIPRRFRRQLFSTFEHFSAIFGAFSILCAIFGGQEGAKRTPRGAKAGQKGVQERWNGAKTSPNSDARHIAVFKCMLDAIFDSFLCVLLSPRTS